MLTHPKILVWGALNFEKLPKTGFRNAADMYSKACINQTNSDRHLTSNLDTKTNEIFKVLPSLGWALPIFLPW